MMNRISNSALKDGRGAARFSILILNLSVPPLMFFGVTACQQEEFELASDDRQSTREIVLNGGVEIYDVHAGETRKFNFIGTPNEELRYDVIVTPIGGNADLIVEAPNSSEPDEPINKGSSRESGTAQEIVSFTTTINQTHTAMVIGVTTTSFLIEVTRDISEEIFVRTFPLEGESTVDTLITGYLSLSDATGGLPTIQNDDIDETTAYSEFSIDVETGQTLYIQTIGQNISGSGVYGIMVSDNEGRLLETGTVGSAQAADNTDDTVGGANVIAIDSPTFHTIAVSDTEDWFQFTLPVSQN